MLTVSPSLESTVRTAFVRSLAVFSNIGLRTDLTTLNSLFVPFDSDALKTKKPLSRQHSFYNSIESHVFIANNTRSRCSSFISAFFYYQVGLMQQFLHVSLI